MATESDENVFDTSNNETCVAAELFEKKHGQLFSGKNSEHIRGTFKILNRKVTSVGETSHSQ